MESGVREGEKRAAILKSGVREGEKGCDLEVRRAAARKSWRFSSLSGIRPIKKKRDNGCCLCASTTLHPPSLFFFARLIANAQSACPTALGLRNKHLIVRLQGLEPWTNRLRVYCSTN